MPSKLIKHTKPCFQILDFDSKLFGFKTAKILPEILDVKKLQGLLQALRAQNVALVYWSCRHEDLASQMAAQKNKGFLADLKATYKMRLNNLRLNGDLFKNIFEYKGNRSNASLQKLACAAGRYSRFRMDKNFSQDLFTKLYKTWLANSLNGKIAEHVFVYKVSRKLTGLITLGKKNSRGDIGLLAIDPEYRGQHIGTKLVLAAQMQMHTDGQKTAQVVTQLGNIPACKLYETCGFKLEKIENFYHFWL